MLIQIEKLSRQKLLQQHLILLQYNYLGHNFQCIFYIEISGFLGNYKRANIFPATKYSTKYQPYWLWFLVKVLKWLFLSFTGVLSHFSREMLTEIDSLMPITLVPAMLFNHDLTMKTSNHLLMCRSSLQILLFLFQDYPACAAPSQSN